MRKAEILILAEDLRQQNFARRYIQRLGFNSPQIRQLPLPNGKGSGEQFVRENYPIQVKEYRRHTGNRASVLIVAIDADAGTVHRRSQQLRDALINADLRPRQDEEVIVHFIPKRHIETWILCLNGEHVNEDGDYSNREVEQQIKSAAQTFHEWTRPHAHPPAHCIESLRAGIPEAQRLESIGG